MDKLGSKLVLSQILITTESSFLSLINKASLENTSYYEDHMILQTIYPDDQFLDQILLSFGTEAEIVSPDHIRNRLKEKALSIYQQYL